MEKKTIKKKASNKKNTKQNREWFGLFEKNKKINAKVFMIVALLMGVTLIISTYAWFSASLDVQIEFFDLAVATDNGLFISLDGVTYSTEIEVSLESTITDLFQTYPNHTNQWATGGMWPVSTNGISSINNNKFDVFIGGFSRDRKDKTKRLLYTQQANESSANSNNIYVAFDIFLKNISGSPFEDNLYFDDTTTIDFEEGTPIETIESMTNIMNSMRIGVVKMASVPADTDVKTVQNLKCGNSGCQDVIYELNPTLHSDASIEAATKYGISLTDGQEYPSYGVIAEGIKLQQASGHVGTGIPLDTDHFALQEAITTFDNPIFKIPNGVTKFRVYVWIEGQDIDSLETNSDGAPLYIGINFLKDTAAYE